jgi:hypothetical protein
MQFSSACAAREKDWGGTAPDSSLDQEIKNAAAILQRQTRTVSHELKSAATPIRRRAQEAEEITHLAEDGNRHRAGSAWPVRNQIAGRARIPGS